MVEPIGIASGALALATFALNSSVSLYQTVQSFQNNRREIRELREELEALRKVTKSLQELASEDEVRFEALRLPLLRCGKACTDFDQVIANCTKHSRESKTSFRDWVKLQYMGSDIAGFKNMLAGYKATINIAIADVNLYVSAGPLASYQANSLVYRHTAAVTANTVQEFKEMLENTRTDLRDHLESLNDKLEALSIHESSATDETIAEEGGIREEIDSVKDCLAVCAEASEHVDKVRTNVFEDVSAAQDAHQVIVSTLADLISAKRVTAGVGARQWLGQMSDATVQQLARSQGIDLGGGSGISRGVEEQD